jgi:hypothetical protein
MLMTLKQAQMDAEKIESKSAFIPAFSASSAFHYYTHPKVFAVLQTRPAQARTVSV